jgi:hypothetical protein
MFAALALVISTAATLGGDMGYQKQQRLGNHHSPPTTGRPSSSWWRKKSTAAATMSAADDGDDDATSRRAAVASHLGPLNAVTDFNAVPDGRVVDTNTGQVGGTDNTKALQTAIHAAQRQGRPLFIPAGRYMINHTLLVGCATPATTCPGCTPTGDAGACVEPNVSAGSWGLHPLILAGAGRSLTTIAAQQDMHAMLRFVSPPGGGTLGKSSILHDVRDLVRAFSYRPPSFLPPVLSSPAYVAACAGFRRWWWKLVS